MDAGDRQLLASLRVPLGKFYIATHPLGDRENLIILSINTVFEKAMRTSFLTPACRIERLGKDSQEGQRVRKLAYC